MTAALRRLAVHKETLRHDQTEVVLRGSWRRRAATFLLDLSRSAGTEVRGQTAVDNLEQIELE